MRSDIRMEQDAFDLGMRFSSAYRERTSPEIWELFRKRYLEFLKNPPALPKIPKKIHQIWLGSDLPDIYKPLIKKLRELHADWEYKLWTDQDLADFDFQNKSLFMESKNFGQKSDILRYETLHRFGGIYIDLDFAAIRPMDNLLNGDFFSCLGYDRDPHMINGVIGTAPHNEFTQNLIRLENFNSSSDAMAIMDSTGPYHLTRAFKKAFKESAHGVPLPNTYFYPYPNFPRDRSLGGNFQSYLGPNSYACHLWHCSWLKKKHKSHSLNSSILQKVLSIMRAK
jgi:mannosyltransferase OCH1-like enzyme